ncbi:MAG: hypothetical protein FWD17_08395 [Polyangiaceae bacterium]|nr:hypothetical protein [Polyangiaceae bacterium]
MKTAVIAGLLSLAIACSSRSEPPDPTSRFLGTWIYQPGSSIVADCTGAASYSIDLSNVPPQNQPGFFTFTSTSRTSLHEVDARGCEYDWSVSGDVATAGVGQSCATFPDGAGGNRLVHLSSGTKSIDGASMSVDVHFVTDAPSSCTIAVQGTATKSTPGA